jgi:nicotinamide-nucleotide amidase
MTGAVGRARLRTLRCTGIDLADVERRLTPWLDKGVSVRSVPGRGEVLVRLRAAAPALGELEAAVLGALGQDCYGKDQESLEAVVGRLLRDRQLTLSVAESCTGGLLGHRITNVPGSSVYFERGVVAYSNRAKEELLRVPSQLLAAHGAVSGPVAEVMARGIREVSGSQLGLSITGVAGPDGGTPAKPVGTVFIGLAGNDGARSRHFLFSGNRESIKWQSSQQALDLLRRHLLTA